MSMNEKSRSIQEYVPGKQITLAHVIPSPNEAIYEALGLENQKHAVGILTITPSEAAIIAADIAMKAANIELGFLDRFSGSLVINGDVMSVETAIEEILNMLENVLGFTACQITKF